MYNYRSLGNVHFGGDNPAGPSEVVLNNLITLIPTEAVTIVTALSSMVDNDDLATYLVTGGALAVAILVRWLAKATVAVYATTGVAFALWMCLVPSSAAHLIVADVASHTNQVRIVILALIYSTIITLLTTSGKLK